MEDHDRKRINYTTFKKKHFEKAEKTLKITGFEDRSLKIKPFESPKRKSISPQKMTPRKSSQRKSEKKLELTKLPYRIESIKKK